MEKKSFDVNNWGYPPHNKESFQHVRELFSTVTLTAEETNTTSFEYKEEDISKIKYELKFPGFEGEYTIQDMLDKTYTDSFLLMKDGVIIYEKYFNGMTEQSVHLMNSVSKSFLGILIGTLVDEGLVKTEKLLTDYLPDFKDTGFSGTTVQQALDMTGSVKYGEVYLERESDFWKETSVVGWRPALVNDKTPETLYEYARGLKEVEQENGSAFHYRTVYTNILGMVAEKVTGKTLKDLLQKKLWEKICPEQNAYIVCDKDEFPYMGAGMNACTRDLARFGQMIVNRGMFGNERVVSEDWIVKTLAGTDKARQNFEVTEYTPLIPGGHYMNQFWASSNSEILACVGIHGQGIYMNMANKTIAVKFSSHPDPDDGPLFIETFTALDALTRSI